MSVSWADPLRIVPPDAERSIVDDEREEQVVEAQSGRADLAPHELGCVCCATWEDWT